MATEHVPLDLIDDNPFNPRQEYPAARVKEMAISLQYHGQLETPQGRRVDGRVQLASGHLRLRALRLNQKREPGNWTTMHLDVVDILDDDMFLYAVEENIKRHELTPLELARSIDAFCQMRPSFTETDLAKQFGFTLGHVSNMRRVLRLPESILNAINEGKISFTQGRELLVLEALENPEEAMKSAYGSLKIGGRNFGEPNTVAGMQTAVYQVVQEHCRPLDKNFGGWRWDLLFDPATAGCDKCEHTVKVVPQKGKSAMFCTDSDCWDKLQEERRQAASAEARQRMEDEVVSTAAEDVALEEITAVPEETVDPEALSKRIAAAPAPVSAAEQDFSQEKDPGTKLRAKMLADMEEDYPCKHCPKNADCNFSHVTLDGHKKYQCFERDKPVEKPQEIPEEVLARAREKAGTRAEVLDMMEISTGPKYSPQLKSGYVNLAWEQRSLDDFEECSERCTTGFHFAFDPRDDEPRTLMICSNPECLKKKKASRTRRLNAAGQEKKKREQKGIKAAIAATTALHHGRMKLVLHTQIKGYHIASYYGGVGAKQPATWLWDKVSPGIKSGDRTLEKLWKAVDKLSEEALAKLVVEFCFYALTDHGDIGDHKVKVEDQLRWLGVSLEEEKKDEKEPTETPARRRGKAKAAAATEEEAVATTEES